MAHGHSSDAFTIDCLEGEVAILDHRLKGAISYLLGNQDVGYGISPVGVQTLLDILRGEFARAHEGTETPCSCGSGCEHCVNDGGTWGPA